MKIDCVWEHHGNDSILYANSFVGAFTRGASKEEAIRKMPDEIRRFRLWRGETPRNDYEIEIVQEKESGLQIDGNTYLRGGRRTGYIWVCPIASGL